MSEYKITPDLLTIILTTSPVPSAPSAELIQRAFASLPDCLSLVPVIITFDNFIVTTNESGRLKKGHVPQNLADQYPAYIENVQNLFGKVSPLIDDSESLISRSLDRDITFLVLKKRNGFGFSVKIALKHVKTPYVLIFQHDWCFTNPHPPISHLLSILQTEDEVQYIGFISRMSLNYETSKGDSNKHYRYIFSQARNLRSNCPYSNYLTACLHWFDRPHLCSVETYRQIFATSNIRRGDFIEDTFGTEYVRSMINAPSKEIAFERWKKWGAWMYYPDDGKKISIQHLHGRKVLFGENKEEMVKNMIKSNISKPSPTIMDVDQENYLMDTFYIDFDENSVI